MYIEQIAGNESWYDVPDYEYLKLDKYDSQEYEAEDDITKDREE
jgi:hypothetical protein